MQPHPGSTVILLQRIRDGDDDARDRLLARYLPRLQRWAQGRLPGYARGNVDTNDLVQVTFLRTLRNLDRFEQRHDGAFLAYLRRILVNCIRDEIRRASRHPDGTGIDEDDHVHPEPSPLEQLLGADRLERYERALARLTDRQQEAVVLRVELGFDYAEVAEAVGAASADAARMTVNRAIRRLAQLIEEEETEGNRQEEQNGDLTG